MNSLMTATVCRTCKAHQMKITEEVGTSITSTFLLTCPCGGTLHISTSKKLSSDGTNPLRSAFELNRNLSLLSVLLVWDILLCSYSL